MPKRVLAFAICALIRAHDLARVEASDEAMGATFSIVAYGENRAQLGNAIAAAFQEVHRLDRMLSNYDSNSEWSEVNRSAAQHPVSVSPELFQLLADCMRYSRESEGAFDLTVGPLMRVWGFYKREGRMLDAAKISEALERVGYRHVQLDRRRDGSLRSPRRRLDPAASVKATRSTAWSTF